MTIVTKSKKSCAYRFYEGNEEAYCGRRVSVKTSKGHLCAEHAAYILSCSDTYEVRDQKNKMMSVAKFIQMAKDIEAPK